MTARTAAWSLALGIALAAPDAFADGARTRDGGSSGSDAGSRHHGGGGGGGGSSSGGSVSSSSGGSSSSSGSSSSHSAPSYSSRSDAERRHPRAGTGTGDRDRHGNRRYYYPGYYYNNYPYYGGYGWPYGGYWYRGYYGSPYYYGGGGYYRVDVNRDTAALRLLVEPEKTRVYVDGYYAGVVDDFDGLFQRLHVRPGRHEISFKLEGFRSHRVKVYVGSGSTLKIHHDMEEGGGEETVADLTHGEEDGPEPVRVADRRDDDEDDDGEAEVEDASGDHGRLHLAVRPRDASVYVDGRFQGEGGEVGSLSLPAGRHRLEVVRPGFRPEARDVRIEAGETESVDVELERP